MKTYSYAFGDHSLFLRKGVASFPSLERAIIGEQDCTLLYVYDDALFSCYPDVLVGGRIVMVIDWQALMVRLDGNWFGRIKNLSAIDILERYIRLVIRCRLKEQV